jgi:hypothetical protein
VAKTKNPHEAALKSWETRRKSRAEWGPAQQRGDWKAGSGRSAPSAPLPLAGDVAVTQPAKLMTFQENDGKAAIGRIKKRLKDFEIPKKALDSLAGVSVVPEVWMKALAAEHEGAVGLYRPAEKTISLSSEWGAANDLAHEIGHHVHLSKLSDEAVSEWADISKNGQEAHISSYAQTNVTEHFAEAFAAYAEAKRSIGASLRKQLQYSEPKAFAFMERLFKTPSMWLPDGKTETRDYTSEALTHGYEAPKRPQPPVPRGN